MQFPNGSANLTYLLTFTAADGGEQQFVLRRPPFGVVAPGAHDMAREFRLCPGCGGPTTAPARYLFCDDHDVVGADFVAVRVPARRGGVGAAAVVDGEASPTPGGASGWRRSTPWPTCTSSIRRPAT